MGLVVGTKIITENAVQAFRLRACGRSTKAYAVISKLCTRPISCFYQKWENFLYLFYRDFAKIYGPSQILQKYTSAVVGHSVRDITSWPTAVGAARSWPLAWPRRGAPRHDVRGLVPWATASGPSAMGHSGSSPASAMGHSATVQLPI
jgi:hypothetical protein